MKLKPCEAPPADELEFWPPLLFCEAPNLKTLLFCWAGCVLPPNWKAGVALGWKPMRVKKKKEKKGEERINITSNTHIIIRVNVRTKTLHMERIWTFYFTGIQETEGHKMII